MGPFLEVLAIVLFAAIIVIALALAFLKVAASRKAVAKEDVSRTTIELSAPEALELSEKLADTGRKACDTKGEQNLDYYQAPLDRILRFKVGAGKPAKK